MVLLKLLGRQSHKHAHSATASLCEQFFLTIRIEPGCSRKYDKQTKNNNKHTSKRKQTNE